MARPLKVFMRGKSITVLQEALRLRGYSIQDQKGLFGTDTRDAVKSFQKQNSLPTSGIVDDVLMKLIQQGHAQITIEKKPKKTFKANPISEERLEALHRLLIRKGLIEEGELEAEMSKVVPTSL